MTKQIIILKIKMITIHLKNSKNLLKFLFLELIYSRIKRNHHEHGASSTNVVLGLRNDAMKS